MARSEKKLEISIINDETNEIKEKKESVLNFELNAEIVAGKLTSNAVELKANIEKELQKYNVNKYLDNPDAAKTDKAFLNKLSDAVSTKRKEIENAWNKPLDDFKNEMKGVEKAISEASNKLKEIVDQAANQEKEQKRKQIEEYWKTLDFNIVSLEKIFNPKWLNKGFSMKDIMIEVETITEKITSELSTIKSMGGEDVETLQSFYLDTLDLNSTLQKGNQLKENRAKLRAQEEVEKTKSEERKEIDAANEQWRNEKLTNTNIVNSPAEMKKEVVINACDPIMDYTLILHGPKSKLTLLRQYMTQLGITYTKI